MFESKRLKHGTEHNYVISVLVFAICIMFFQISLIFINYLPGLIALISLILAPFIIGVAGVYFGRAAMIKFGDTEDHSDSEIFDKTRKRRIFYLIIFSIVAVLMSTLAGIDRNLIN